MHGRGHQSKMRGSCPSFPPFLTANLPSCPALLLLLLLLLLMLPVAASIDALRRTIYVRNFQFRPAAEFIKLLRSPHCLPKWPPPVA